MATLTGQPIASSYEQLLSLPDGGLNGTALVAITDGDSDTACALSVATTSISIGATHKLYLDAGGNTYIHEVSADKLDIVVGGQTILELSEGGGGASDYMAVQALNKFYLDGSGDTYIQESADGIMDFYSDDVHMLSLDDENDEVDVSRYQANAIVNYVKARYAEDIGDLERKEYFMREFRMMVEKYDKGRAWGPRKMMGSGVYNRK